jgi:hypothetical protein
MFDIRATPASILNESHQDLQPVLSLTRSSAD